jgi:hypothetical protein
VIAAVPGVRLGAIEERLPVVDHELILIDPLASHCVSRLMNQESAFSMFTLPVRVYL